MISILTSSKTMDLDTPPRYDVAMSDLIFSDDSKKIQAKLGNYDKSTIAKLMHISDNLAGHVAGLYSAPTGRRKAAIYAYRGDVYRGLNVDSLSRSEVEWANRHILIPSGLYGLARPFDGIEQYRLEMKTKLPVDGHKNLYSFWGDKLAQYVESLDDTVVVLASNEYAKAVTEKLSDKTRIVDVVFRDKSASGDMKIVPIYSKIMRGVMANYIIKNRIDKPEDLAGFQRFDYSFNKSDSSKNKLIFDRNVSYPIRA